ncbi:hypothetical protein [Sphingobium sp. YBL2]|uniref:hypothetical protein n=1 Tax=Sphingobium sp. (strain YBL2) TaxID=484429 RepID=UPI00155DAB9E|nr:hypothetical protein [Sphingobium sp. YBL2]
MKRFGIFMAGCALTSCATVGELRDRPPVVDVQSSKTVNQVAGCVSEVWSRQKSATVNTMVIENGLVVSVGWYYYSNPVTEAVMEVKDEGEYRRVKFFSRAKKRTQKDIEAYNTMLRPCVQ